MELPLILLHASLYCQHFLKCVAEVYARCDNDEGILNRRRCTTRALEQQPSPTDTFFTFFRGFYYCDCRQSNEKCFFGDDGSVAGRKIVRVLMKEVFVSGVRQVEASRIMVSLPRLIGRSKGLKQPPQAPLASLLIHFTGFQFLSKSCGSRKIGFSPKLISSWKQYWLLRSTVGQLILRGLIRRLFWF